VSGHVEVSVVIDAAPEQVWEEVRHIDRHVDWMADARSITFTSPGRSGVGTTFDCLTQVGPIRLTDRMAVTGWTEGESIGVRHEGLVTGRGVFELTRAGDEGTRFSWTEDLEFPWWLGGPIGAAVGGRVLEQIWRKNLRVLKELVEQGRS